MIKPPRASAPSRCLLLIGLIGPAAGACASQSVPPAVPAALAPQAALGPASPEPSIGEEMALRSEQGSIDREDAEAAIMANWSRLKACYQEAGDATSFAEGAVTLRFDVDLSGSTTGVDVIESRLGNFAVERCLSGMARAVRFPRPYGGGRARVEYTLEFRSTDERPVVEPPPDAVEELRTALLIQLFTACGPLGANDSEATVYLDRRGHVVSAGLGGRTPLASERGACAALALASGVVPGRPTTTTDGLLRMSFSLSDADLAAARAASGKRANVRRPQKDRLAAKAGRQR